MTSKQLSTSYILKVVEMVFLFSLKIFETAQETHNDHGA